MSTHARKKHTEASLRQANPVWGTEFMKKAAGGMYGMDRQDANVAAAINSEIFGQFAEMAAGNGVPREIQELTNEITQSYTCHMAKLVEFSNAAMKCKSLGEMVELNAKAMQYFYSDYVNETLKLSSKFFGNDGLARMCRFNSAGKQICAALGG